MASYSQDVSWTALPAGRTASTLKLSVFVTPKLYKSDTSPVPVSNWPDWIDWPTRKITFKVLFNGSAAPGPVTVVSAAPSVSRWKDVFDSTVMVNPYEFQSLPPNTRLRTSPLNQLRDYLKTTYLGFASSNPTDFPTSQDLVGSYGQGGPYGGGALSSANFGAGLQGRGPLTGYVDTLNTGFIVGGDRANNRLNLQAVPPTNGNYNTTELALAQHFLFHRADPTAPAPSTDMPAPPVAPDLDFHQIVSSIGDHAPLLRVMALTYDLTIPIWANFPANGTVSVVPTWTPKLASTRNILPTTLYAGDQFWPAGRSDHNEAFEGYLQLGDGNYVALEFDVDGAAHKIIDHATQLGEIASTQFSSTPRMSQDTPDTYSLPAMRSSGLSLAKPGRAFAIVDTLNDQANADATAGDPGTTAGAPALGVEDITRGYRIDVFDVTRNKWGTLTQRSTGPRTGGYHFTKSNTTIAVPAGDAGFIQLTLATDPNRPTNNPANPDAPDVYVGETLLRWDGWSLVAPRPGMHLGPGPNDGPTTTTSSAVHGLDISYSATPGTLPTLRFGHNYRFRVRVADLAGNGPAFVAAAASPDGYLTDAVFYGRLEPVVSPPLLMKQPKTEGESLETVVIRSEWNAVTTGNSQRHITPPRTSELMAEESGVLDTAAGIPDASLYSVIAGKDGAQLTGGTPDPLMQGQPYFSTNTLAIPYLVDAYSSGAIFNGVPGTTTALPVSFYPGTGKWPNPTAFRLALFGTEAGADPKAPKLPTSTSNQLSVFLPQAKQVEITISSQLLLPNLQKMTHWNWFTAAQQSALQTTILNGQHWMFTPFRTITLVHAVRQPLVAPAFAGLRVTKQQPGDTAGAMSGLVTFDQDSTQKLQLIAEWDETIDATGEAGPVTSVGRATPVEQTFEYGGDENDVLSMPADFPTVFHEFRDTKHRTVYYKAIATSRYAEYFVQRKTVTLTGTTAVVLDSHGVVLGPEVVSHSDTATPPNTTTYVRDVDYSLDPVAGTIVRITTGAIASGTSVNVAYNVPPITRVSDEGEPAGFRGVPVNVLSSARPAAPALKYVIPAYQWSRDGASPGNVTSTRQGHLLRVYLNRPWFASGEGELLGVLLAGHGTPPASAPIPDSVRYFVTQYGADPIQNSAEVPLLPQLTDFPRAVATDNELLLPEAGDQNFSVAGHTVQYDPVRKLWYADIEVDTGAAYQPFVRLSLVRYQPNSMTIEPSVDLRLSPTVLAEYAQLSPDRSATITFPNTHTAQVAVSGYSSQQQPGTVLSLIDTIRNSVVEVTVQGARPGVSDPDLKWVDLGVPVSLPAVQDVSDTFTTWVGKVPLPNPLGSTPMRLLIKEYEVYPNDTFGGTLIPIQQTTRRAVYIDTLEI